MRMFFSKTRQDFTDVVIHVYGTFELLVLLPFSILLFKSITKTSQEKIFVPQIIIIRHLSNCEQQHLLQFLEDFQKKPFCKFEYLNNYNDLRQRCSF